MSVSSVIPSFITSLASFPFAHFRCTFWSQSPIVAHQPLTAMWRSALAEVLHGWQDRTDMSSLHQKAYQTLFAPKKAPDSPMRGSNDIPRPLVLCAPVSQFSHIKQDQIFSLEFRLIGDTLAYMPCLLEAFKALEMSGIGDKRKEGMGRFRLLKLEQALSYTHSTVLYDPYSTASFSCQVSPLPQSLQSALWSLPFTLDAPHVEVQLQTPLSFKVDQQLVTRQTLTLYTLLQAITRRISRLSYFTKTFEPFSDLFMAIQDAQNITPQSVKVQAQSFKRYSSESDSEIYLRGLTGTIRWGSEALPFLPLLLAGSLVHVGKNTIMGFGQYEVLTS